MDKKTKLISLFGLGACLSVGVIYTTTALIKDVKLKATNEDLHEWVLTAGDFEIGTGDPHEYSVTSPGGSINYIFCQGFRPSASYDLTIVKPHDPNNPNFICNYEDVDENDHLVSAIRGIKSITLQGDDEHLSDLKIMVGEDGIHGSVSNDSASLENFVDIKDMKDDVNYNYFYIENKSEYDITPTSITITYSCSEEPSSKNYPFVFKANEGETIVEYALRYDTEYWEVPYSTSQDFYIPETYNGYPVTEIYGDLSSELYFENLEGILHIPNTITLIKPYAFAADAFEDENSGILFVEKEECTWVATRWNEQEKKEDKEEITFTSSKPNENGKKIAEKSANGWWIRPLEQE